MGWGVGFFKIFKGERAWFFACSSRFALNFKMLEFSDANPKPDASNPINPKNPMDESGPINPKNLMDASR